MTDFVAGLGYVAVGTRLRRLGERMQADVQEMLKANGVGVPASQMPLLACIAAHGPQGISAIAAALGVSQPAVTRTVNNLLKAGMVAIHTTDGDQRGRTVSLTPIGRRITAAVMAELAPAIGKAVEEIARDARGDLLKQLAHFEAELDKTPLLERMAKARRTSHV